MRVRSRVDGQMVRAEGWFARRVVAAVAGATLVACAGYGGAAAREAGGAGTGSDWSREVTPFPVLDADGRPYDHAFLGGFDVPRPQLVDIDADGDLDLFIQERSNELMHLENVGTPSAAQFAWRTDRFAGVDIAEWYRFIDMDRDGRPDLLSERPFSYIRYYHNAGPAAAPRFELAADTVRTAEGEPLFSDRQNIPNATDLDCDGLTDLFIGKLTGTVARYELVEGALPEPRFRLLSDRFEDIEIVANVMGSMRHGANTMDFADHDGDGDVDLFWGDFFEQGLLLLENTGSCASPSIRNVPVPFPRTDPVKTTGYNAPTVGDLNGDGRPDMLIGVLGGAYNPTLSAIENLYFLEHTPETFEVRTTRYLYGIDVGSESIPELADLDGDGDLDLLLGSKIDPADGRTGRIHHFENVGSAGRPSFRERPPLPISGHYHYAPEAGDLDGDGVLDLLVGTWNDEVLLYRNAGTARSAEWELAAEPLVELTRGSNSTPAVGDVDGDGDLDLLVGEASGTVNFYRNAGSATQPSYELVSDEWEGIDVGRRSQPALVDLDGDGDLDLVIGNEAGELRVWRNAGTRAEPRFVSEQGSRLPRLPYGAPAFGDLDGDGSLEILLGNLSGGVGYYRR
ncbi:MAG: VCBS repeat-containing protein [Gemmatimonadetes bacterium]|nr:VCBS repeat-containing protein [Gemmatimonadota bacterium]